MAFRARASKSAIAFANYRLFLAIFIYSLGNIFYGFAAASFGGIQAMTPFARQFGVYFPETDTYGLRAKTASLMNSIPLIGKLVGTIIAGQWMERFGHRYSMVFACICQLLGVVLELTTKTTVQYTAGCFMIYIAVGIVENAVPAYASEIAPAPLRGFLVGTLQPFLNFGSLLACIVNYFCAKSTTRTGWMVATGLQGITAVLVLALLPFTPDSPRWLISRGRDREAVLALRKVRRSDYGTEGCAAEVVAIKHSTHSTKKGSWWELFSTPVNRRRTGISVAILTLYHLCGITFVSIYGPTFYNQIGLESRAFAYQAVTQACATVAGILGMIVSDAFGRRNLTIIGTLITTAFLCIVGGIGTISNPSTAAINTMVAFIILYVCLLSISIGPTSYIVGAEVGTASLREKTLALGTAMNVVSSFVVVFTVPYLLVDAGLGSKTAFIYAGWALFTAIWAIFGLPELKGRSLEELDELFEVKPPLAAWKFTKYQTTGFGRLVREIELGHNLEVKADGAEIEDVKEGIVRIDAILPSQEVEVLAKGD
ncbi:maltose permease [Rhinocladiella similis]